MASEVDVEESTKAPSGGLMVRLGDWFRTPLPYILLVAALARVVSVMVGGGFRGVFLYDDGVYYSAARALGSGLMPYRDFVLVHPPGSTVVFAPIAMLSEVSSDSTAFAVARVAVICLGVLNTALIYRVAGAAGKFAAATAALLYAVWFPVVFAERSTLLEPFVILGTIGSLALLFNTKRASWKPWVAGILIGIGISTKLWAVIPMLVILIAVLVGKRVKDSIFYVLGAAATATVIMGPFFLAAPSQMFGMIVTDQMGRTRGGTTIFERLGLIFNLDAVHVEALGKSAWIAIALVTVVLVVAAVMAFIRIVPARLWVILFVVQVLVLLAVPVFFTGYPTFAAPALMLVIGAFAQVLWNLAAQASWRPYLRGGLVAGLLVGFALCAVYVVTTPKAFGALPPAAIRAVADGRCVASDRPATTVVADKLTSSLKNGCPIVVDFTGAYYSTKDARGGLEDRRLSPDYQGSVQRYFAGSDYVIISRLDDDRLSPETVAQLTQRPVVFSGRGGNLVIYGPKAS